MMQVSPNATLLTPLQCKSLCMQFIKEIEYEVTLAVSLQVPYYILLVPFMAFQFTMRVVLKKELMDINCQCNEGQTSCIITLQLPLLKWFEALLMHG
jgi:hypothetical protein